MTSKPAIRGSRSAFMHGRTVFTKYGGGCLRNILISSKIPRVGDIDPIHIYRGHLYEDEYGKMLDAQGTDYEREVEVIDDRPDGVFSGHLDFLIGGKRVIELKSSQSKSRLRDIKKGEYIEDNLAQAVSYMVATEATSGALIYSYWEPQSDGTLKMLLEYTHEIAIDMFGRISDNGAVTKWSVHDLLAHQHHAFKVLKEEIIWDRPHNHAQLWGSPCHYCPFKSACDSYDAGTVTDLQGLLEAATRDTSSLANKTEGQPSNEEVTNE